LIEIPEDKKVWVVIGEAAEITGYHRNYLQKIARKMWLQPEDERLIQLRKRASHYELWLPDLLDYIKNHGYGPHNPKRVT